MVPFVETIQSDQCAPGAGDTVTQNNSIDEARRLDILDAARGAGDAVAIQLEPIQRPGRRVEAQP